MPKFTNNDLITDFILFDKFRKKNEGNYSTVESVQVTLASNLGFRIRNDELDSKDLNKI